MPDKLSEEMIEEILRLRREYGWGYGTIANELGVGRTPTRRYIKERLEQD